MAGVTTTTDLAHLIQEQMGDALAGLRAQSVFWPGSPGHGILDVADLTNVDAISADFNRFSKLTALDTVEGEDMAAVQQMTPSSTNVAATEKQIITWISDLAMRGLGNPNNAAARAAKEAAEHAAAHAEKFDQEIFALATSLTAGATDTGADITNSDVYTAVNKCFTLNMPRPWIGFLHPEQLLNLAAESGSPFLDIAKSGDVATSVWQNYDIQRAYGVTWIISNSAYNDGTDVWGMILSRRAIGCVLDKFPEVTAEYDQSRRATEISSVSSWNAGVVEATAGVYIRTDAP